MRAFIWKPSKVQLSSVQITQLRSGQNFIKRGENKKPMTEKWDDLNQTFEDDRKRKGCVNEHFTACSYMLYVLYVLYL